MAAKKLTKFAQENNMHVKGDYVYGVYKGYHITMNQILVQYIPMTDIYVSIANFDEAQKDTIKDFIKSNRKALSVALVKFKNGELVIRAAAAGDKKQRLLNTLDALTEFLQENSILSGCRTSGETQDLQFVFYKGMVTPVSQDLAAKYAEESQQLAEDNEYKGYLSGTIGAVIGGIIGVIPWVVIGLLGYISSLSGVAMGWLVKTGYSKARGKLGGAQLAILIITVIVFTYFGIMASQTLFLVQLFMEEGYALSDLYLIEIFKYVVVLPFTSEPGVGEIWGSIAQGYLFAALGSFVFFSKARDQKEFTAVDKIDVNIEQPVV